MDVLLYIQVKAAEKLHFGNPWGSFCIEHYPNARLLDADNHSGDLVIEEELKMLKEAQSCCLLLDAEATAKPGKSIRLIESVLRNRNLKSLIHLKGNNEVLEKMLRLSNSDYRQNLSEEDLKKLLLSFKS